MIEKHRQVSTQIVTDACCIYRREIVKPLNSNAMILRGREIAYEAAHSPTIASSMPNYTQDQIRELYGELDQKTRRLQENEYILHTPPIDAWQEKPSGVEECPLPKFRLEKNDPTMLMSGYVSTGLSNNPRTVTHTNDKECIRGSFRTSIADRTSISPSPLIFNVHLDFNKVLPPSPEILPTLAKISELMDMDSLIDLDAETTIPYETEISTAINHDENLPIENLIRIVHAIHHYHFVYDETNDKEPTEEIATENQTINIEDSDFLYTKDNVDDFGDLYERYITNLDHYDAMIQEFDQFEQKTDLLTPISEESVTLIEHIQENQTMKSHSIDEFCSTLTCKRQENHIGHYGFELEQTFDGNIQISSITNSKYCPHLKIGDELISIHHHSSLKTLEQYHLLLHSLWYKHHDHIQISIRTPKLPSKYILFGIKVLFSSFRKTVRLIH